MLVARLKTAMAVLLVIAAAGVGAGSLIYHAQAGEPAKQSGSSIQGRADEKKDKLSGDQTELFIIRIGQDNGLRSIIPLIPLGKAADADVRAKAVQALLEVMAKDSDKGVRGTAAETLRSMGQAAVPALKQALKADDPKVRNMAAAVLGSIGPEAEEAIPNLLKTMKDSKEDIGVRQKAVYALGQIGRREEVVVPALIEALKGRDHNLRGMAAQALGDFGPHSKAAVPLLIEMVKSREGDWAPAVTALGDIGPDAKAAVPVLTELLKDPCLALSEVAEAAAEALERIQTKPKK